VKKLSLVTVMLFMLLSSAQVLSQTVINYHSATMGTLSTDLPIVIYTFLGTAGDQITIQAISLSADLDLSATLQNGTETLTANEGDPFTVGSTDARIDFRLPETSTYVVLVSSPSTQTGHFIMKLSGQPLTDKTVQANPSIEISIESEDTSYYSFSSHSDMTTVTLNSSPSDFEFHAVVYDGEGRIVHTSVGTSTIINVGDEGDFEIALRAVDPTAQGGITVSLGGRSVDLATTIEATPSPTRVTAVTVVATKNINPIFGANDDCGVFSRGFPNLRTGPSTSHAIITQVQPGIAYTVFGEYLDWYQVLVPIYGAGWVRNSVVGIGGDCGNIRFISPNNTPVLPTHTPTATGTPTATHTHTPTATSTATDTPTTTDTPRPSPTIVIQIASEDASPNSPLNVPLGNTVSVSEFVSYPNGDTEDVVNWDVIGMDSDSADERAQLVITATCFGDDTASVEFTISGQIYNCGDTLVDEAVTIDSKTGSIIIMAFSGEDTYVQWVLTGSATRLE
jgi:hypothetical protein